MSAAASPMQLREAAAQVRFDTIGMSREAREVARRYAATLVRKARRIEVRFGCGGDPFCNCAGCIDEHEARAATGGSK